MRPKKQKKEVKKEEPSETHSHDDDASSGSGGEMKEINSNQPTAVTAKPTAFAHHEQIYEPSILFDAIIKINNTNYSGNMSLLWGKIKP